MTDTHSFTFHWLYLELKSKNKNWTLFHSFIHSRLLSFRLVCLFVDCCRYFISQHFISIPAIFGFLSPSLTHTLTHAHTHAHTPAKRPWDYVRWIRIMSDIKIKRETIVINKHTRFTHCNLRAHFYWEVFALGQSKFHSSIVTPIVLFTWKISRKKEINKKIAQWMRFFLFVSWALSSFYSIPFYFCRRMITACCSCFYCCCFVIVSFMIESYVW